MKLKQEIFEELEVVAPELIKLQDSETFLVPLNYFSTISHRLLIKLSSYKNNFQVPEGYFDQLPHRILDKINELEFEDQEIEEKSSILDELKSKQVFTVPEGYFDKFSVATDSAPSKQAIVRPLFPKRFMWKNIAAALVTGVIAINALWIFNQDGNNSNLSSVSENPGIYTSIQAAKKITSEEQLNAGISNLSSDDIVKYLSSNGNDLDNENVINNINENDLPNQDPSLDQNTIHNFLNN